MRIASLWTGTRRRSSQTLTVIVLLPLGGLEWLLAAGLGYGVYRLRGQGDGDAAA